MEKNKEDFIKKVSKIHPELDFSDTKYVNSKTSIKVVCPKHGEFTVSPNRIIKSEYKCSECKKEELFQIKKEETIRKMKEKHNGKYEYVSDTFNYVRNKMKIICPEHGEFWQSPYCHMKGQGCPKCAGTYSMNLNEFKKTANIVHDNKYDYSLINEYNGIYTKLPIVCHERDETGEEHGLFYQTAKNHLKGFGCKKCSSNYMDLQLFVKRSNKIHGNCYNYKNISLYKNNTTKVPIECSKHGIFYQTPNMHLSGQGCPYCKESHLEKRINNVLNDCGFCFERQKRFEWLINDKTSYKLPLDFYLTEYNIAIECQGEQHFVANFYKTKGIDYVEEHLKNVQYRDLCKKRLCKENGICLIYFTEKRFAKFLKEDDIFFTDEMEMIDYLKRI